MESLPFNDYFYLFLLGGFLGLAGATFNVSLLKYKSFYVQKRWIPVFARPVIPLILAGLFIIFFPRVLGGGLGVVESLTKNNFSISFIIILLLLKFAFTIISYGSGAPGGIFLPMLALGAISGKLIILILQHYTNIDPIYANNFIMLAMAGYFAAVVKAPITGIVLITEMSESFKHFLPLAIVVFVAYVISSLLGTKPIYESLMERSLINNEYSEFAGDRKTKTVLEIQVFIDSKIENKKIMDLPWPEDCLLVGIKRGSHDIIPKGNTIIYPGDILVLITNEDKANRVQSSLEQITGICEIETYHQYEFNVSGFFGRISEFFRLRRR